MSNWVFLRWKHIKSNNISERHEKVSLFVTIYLYFPIKDNATYAYKISIQKINSFLRCYKPKSLKVPTPPESPFPLAILHLHWIIFPLPIHTELMSETMDQFSFYDASIPHILVSKCPEEISDRCIQLGRHVTVAQKGLLRIECLIAPARTWAGAKPDGPWTS